MIAFFIAGIFMLGLSVFVHEMGHYLMGRLVGIQAETFSIGFGKAIWKKKVGPTTWQLAPIPLGGFVRFYGDRFDMEEDQKQGSFMGSHPMRRIVAIIGGPLFNLILAMLLFLFINSLTGPVLPQVRIIEELGPASPAYIAGLRDGDLVVSVNGKKVDSFEDIRKETMLHSGRPLQMVVERQGKRIEFQVKPEVGAGGVSYIGIRPPGERKLQVNYPTGDLWMYKFKKMLGMVSTPPANLRAVPYLDHGDVILEVEGQKPGSVVDMHRILGEHHNEVVTITVERQSLPWLTPWITHRMTVEVPTRGEYRVDLKNILDKKYDKTISEHTLMSANSSHQRGLGSISINGKPAGSYQKVYEQFANEKTADLLIDGQNYRATIQAEKIGLVGFQAGETLDLLRKEGHEGPVEVLQATYQDTIDNLMLYPRFFSSMFAGRVDFVENTKGPVGLFAIAGAVFNSGIEQYLKLFAAISIALMVMNLLPLPILDGGHVVINLFEAISGKPVSLSVLDVLYRVTFIVFLGVGMLIMYRDIIFLFQF